MIRALAVLAVALAVGIPAATAGQQDAPGVTPTTVLIGGTVPLTGPAAAFGVVGPGAAAYFAYVNDHGGVNGRKIIYKYYDDGYDPAQTVQLTRQLVQQDNVLAVFNTIGTPNALAVQPLLNQLKVPGLFAGTGASAFNDFKQYPWTMGYLPSFSAEGAIYGRQIAAKKPRAKIGVLYENSDFGDDLLAGLKKGLGGKAKIVAALGYEATDSDVASQVSRLKGAGADTFMIFATPLFAIKAYIDMHKLGWRPQVYVSSVSIEPTVMQIATASTSPATTAGSTSIAFVKDPTQARWAKDPAVEALPADHGQVRPGRPPDRRLQLLRDGGRLHDGRRPEEGGPQPHARQPAEGGHAPERGRATRSCSPGSSSAPRRRTTSRWTRPRCSATSRASGPSKDHSFPRDPRTVAHRDAPTQGEGYP